MPADGLRSWVETANRRRPDLDRAAYRAARAAEPERRSLHLRAVEPKLFDAVGDAASSAGAGPGAGDPACPREVSHAEGMTDVRKAQLVRDPVRPADPADRPASWSFGDPRGAGLVDHQGLVPYLWREWITSVDHKRIGVMYMLLGVVMLFRGFIDAIMMRSQQALAFQAPGYLPPEHYDQIFSAHGTIMIFFGAMPLMIGLMNFVVPLQLGVRDVAFPTLNSVELLADGDRRAAGQHLAVRRRVRAHRLAALSAAERVDLFARRRRRLLPLGDPDLRRRHADDRHQFRHHDPQDARARHELSAHADVLLDRARLQPADRRRLPDPDRHAWRC